MDSFYFEKQKTKKGTSRGERSSQLTSVSEFNNATKINTVFIRFIILQNFPFFFFFYPENNFCKQPLSQGNSSTGKVLFCKILKPRNFIKKILVCPLYFANPFDSCFDYCD